MSSSYARILRQFLRVLAPLALVLLAGCAGKKPVEPAAVAAAALPPEFVATHMAVLRCADLAPIGLQLNEQAVRIDLPRAPRDLPQVEAASGAKYEGDGFILWFKDGAALYQQPRDESPRECRVLPVKTLWDGARLRDVSFRALGQEPGWYLEVVQDKWILLVADYGRQRVLMPPVAPVREGEGYRFRAQSGSDSLDVAAAPLTCSDGMSEDVYDQHVTVTYNGVTFTGCGRWLVKP